MNYSQLSAEEKYGIVVLLSIGVSLREIASKLHRSVSTISREIKRNRGKRGYSYKQAQRKTGERHQAKAKAIKLTEEMKEVIVGYLKEDWSQE